MCFIPLVGMLLVFPRRIMRLRPEDLLRKSPKKILRLLLGKLKVWVFLLIGPEKSTPQIQIIINGHSGFFYIFLNMVLLIKKKRLSIGVSHVKSVLPMKRWSMAFVNDVEVRWKNAIRSSGCSP